MGRSVDASVSDTLINLIYDAVLDESGWPQVTHALAQEIGACALQFCTPTLPVGAGGFSYRHGLDESALKIYFDHYHQRDVWVQGSFARGLVYTNSLYSSEAILQDAEYRRSEIWADFNRRLDIFRCCVNVIDDGRSGTTPPVVVVGYRGQRSEPFSARELGLIARLTPHFRRALRMQTQLRPAASSAAELVLRRLAIPVMVLARDATVLFSNAAAERLFQTRRVCTTAAWCLPMALPAAIWRNSSDSPQQDSPNCPRIFKPACA